MNSISNNWQPHVLPTGKPTEENSSIAANNDFEHEDISMHISDKKTKQISRLFETIVLLSIIAVLVFASYRLFMNF